MPPKPVVIDPSVDNYETLIDQLGSTYNYLLLSADSDGVAHLASYLAANPGFHAIHAISHGSPGQVAVGTSTHSKATVGRYTAELNQIGASLNSGGDLLIYGCDVAQGDVGQQLITDIARLTQLDVAASTNTTGSHGEWALEAATGPIENALPLLSYGANLPVSCPTVTWTRLIGSPTRDFAFALTAGQDGSIYLAGEADSTTLDGKPSAGAVDGFVTKFAPDGTKVWTNLIGTTYGDYVFGLTTGRDGAEEGCVAHPIDSKLLETARAEVVEAAQAKGIELKRTYARESHEFRFEADRYAHARQFHRMRKATKRQRTIVGRLEREVSLEMSALSKAVQESLSHTPDKVKRLVMQSARAARQWINAPSSTAGTRRGSNASPKARVAGPMSRASRLAWR
jgi:hypothetical protein